MDSLPGREVVIQCLGGRLRSTRLEAIMMTQVKNILTLASLTPLFKSITQVI